MDLIYILILVFTLETVFLIYFHKTCWISNPVVGFLLFNWVMGVGVFLLLNLDVESDLVHVYITMLTPIFLTLGSILVRSITNLDSRYKSFWIKETILENKADVYKLVFIFVFCVLITILYYIAVGYNLFFLALQGGGGDFTTMRLQAYAGDSYFAPGYVNQFKNTLLPLISFSLIFYFKGRYFHKPLVIFVIFFLTYALLGTGQRTFLVTSLLMFIVVAISIRRGNLDLRKLAIPIIGSVFIFIFLSSLLGRSDEGSFLSGIEALIHRIFASNQISSVYGFRYIYEQEIVWGAEWGKSFAGLLPGVRGSDLSNRIHYILFNSDRGTAPLSIWGSVYHNFGFIGTVIVAFLMGVFYKLLYLRFISGKYSIFRVSTYSALFLYLSIWIAGSPVQLLNNGLAAVLLLLIILKLRLKTKNETSITRYG